MEYLYLFILLKLPFIVTPLPLINNNAFFTPKENQIKASINLSALSVQYQFGLFDFLEIQPYLHLSFFDFTTDTGIELKFPIFQSQFFAISSSLKMDYSLSYFFYEELKANALYLQVPLYFSTRFIEKQFIITATVQYWQPLWIYHYGKKEVLYSDPLISLHSSISFTPIYINPRFNLSIEISHLNNANLFFNRQVYFGVIDYFLNTHLFFSINYKL